MALAYLSNVVYAQKGANYMLFLSLSEISVVVHQSVCTLLPTVL